MENIVLKEVGFNDLEKGTKYIIKRHNKSCYKGRFSGYTYCMGSISHFFDARDIRGLEMYVWRTEFYDEKDITYHKIDGQKEKIQNAMELRAVNIILRRLIGDVSFIYK